MRTIPLARNLVFLASFAFFLGILFQCQKIEEPDTVLITIEPDSVYSTFGKLWIGYTDSAGRDTITLFAPDSLDSFERLKKIEVKSPAAPDIRIIIRGFESGTGKLVYEQTRNVNLHTGDLASLHTDLDLTKPDPDTTKPGKRIPRVQFLSGDTVISIKDSLSFSATVSDTDSVVKSYSLQPDPNGLFGAEFAFEMSAGPLRFGHKYDVPGEYPFVIRIKDFSKREYFDTLLVSVIQDPPTATTGKKLTVTARDSVRLHGVGKDSLGTVVSYAWRLGNGAFGMVAAGDTAFIAPDSAGNQIWVFRVTDDDGNETLDTLTLTIVLASDTRLSLLRVTGFELSPPFSATESFFALEVPNPQDSVEITATPADSIARVMINGVEPPGRGRSAKVKLEFGNNFIPITVTAENGKKKNLSLLVHRKRNSDARLKDIRISAGSLEPKFDSTRFEYQVRLENSQGEMGIAAVPADSRYAKVYIDNLLKQPPDSLGTPLHFNVGVDTVRIRVVAQNDSDTRSYALIVSRVPSSDASLANLELGYGELLPAFSPKILQYSVNVPNSIAEVAFKPTAKASASKILLNSKEAASGVFSEKFHLRLGDNGFVFKIVSEGGDSGSYSVTIHRKSAEVELVSLSVSSGTLVPGFAPGIYSYSDTLDANTDSVVLALEADRTIQQLKVNDAVLAGFKASHAIHLNYGINRVSVVVKSEDGNTQEYVLNLVRNNQAPRLESLEPNACTLSPDFLSDRLYYKCAVQASVSEIEFKPKAINTALKIFLNENETTSGYFSKPEKLAYGDNVFRFTVLSVNRDSLRYEVIVHRISDISALAGLSVSDGTLRPSFLESRLAYIDTLPAGISSITVNTIAADSLVKSISIDGNVFANDSASTKIEWLNTASPRRVAIAVVAEDGSTTNYVIQVSGQGFFREFGDGVNAEEGNNVYQTPDGGYLAMYNSAPGLSTHILKTTSEGMQIWDRVITSDLAHITSLKPAADNGFVGCGYSRGASLYTPNMKLIKIDSQANVAWDKTVSLGALGLIPYDVSQSADGGYFVVAKTGDSSKTSGIAVIKATATGDTSWIRFFGTAGYRYTPLNSMIIEGKDVLVVGTYKATDTSKARIFAARVDDAGTQKWLRHFGGKPTLGLTLTSIDGKLFDIFATIQSGQSTGNDILLLTTNADGDSVFSNTYGLVNGQTVYGAIPTPDKGELIVGYEGSTPQTLFTMKVNAAGDMAWVQKYPYPENHYGTSAVATKDGGFLILGGKQYPESNDVNVFLMKTNGSGQAK